MRTVSRWLAIQDCMWYGYMQQCPFFQLMVAVV